MDLDMNENTTHIMVSHYIPRSPIFAFDVIDTYFALTPKFVCKISGFIAISNFAFIGAAHGVERISTNFESIRRRQRRKVTVTIERPSSIKETATAKKSS